MQRDLPDDLKHPADLPVDFEGAMAAAIARLEMLGEELNRTRQVFAEALEVLRQRKEQP